MHQEVYLIDRLIQNFSLMKDGKCGEQQPHIQHVTSVLPTAVGEYIAQPTQLELLGHTIVKALFLSLYRKNVNSHAQTLIFF